MNIADIINQRKEQRKVEVRNAPIEDLNKPLIRALFGIDIYGKAAVDEDIIKIIIGKTTTGGDILTSALEERWDQLQAEGKLVKKGKSYYADGKLVLRPLTR